MTDDPFLQFLNHVWQSTLFTVIVWLFTLTLEKNRAAVRHRLWLAASVKFLIPFSVIAGIGGYFQWQASLLTEPPHVSTIVKAIGQPFAVAQVSTGAIEAAPVQSHRIPVIFMCVWAFGFAASMVGWFIRWLRVRRLVRRATPIDFQLPMQVRCSPEPLEPGVFGVFRPVLLLPDGITERLSTEQLQAVMAHEVCHVHRHDNMSAAVHTFVEALFWFHPFVWWIGVRLLHEQERACDEEVLRSGSDARVYAESILKICEFCLTSPSISASRITGSNLKNRIEEIMTNPCKDKLSFSKLLILAIGTAITIAGPVAMGVASSRESPGSYERRIGGSAPRTAGSEQQVRIGEPPTIPSFVTPPRAVSTAPPVYSFQAATRLIEGTVTLEAAIDVHGKVEVLRVVNGLGFGLDEQAVLAVQEWIFRPALRNGVPVESIARIDVDFKIPEPSESVVPSVTIDTVPVPGVSSPTVTSFVEPQYSKQAHGLRYQGTELVRVDVRADGSIESIRSVRSLGAGLTEKALESIQQWKFQPALKDERPVDGSLFINVNFTLQRAD